LAQENEKMYFVKTPSILKPLGRDFLWNFPRDKREVYFTFDDGPTQGVTENVLQMLAEYEAKASFFCLGNMAAQSPELLARIKEEGHTIGNHSYSHMDGWKKCTFSYAKDVLKASDIIASNYFRPPYGHITLAQASLLKRKYKLVMWDVLSGDFDQTITKEKCAKNVIENIRNGSIVVFHDSQKAAHNMLYALKESLEFCKREGYILRAI
jgi:peptidoglycan/xylan/chitin deacetylase (PgdA/CDA1 family)